MSKELERIREAKDFVASRLELNPEQKPTIGIILGSGLSSFAEILKQKASARWIAFKDIPHFPISTVEGHKGEIVAGEIDQGAPVLILNGRLHLYEGYALRDVVLPVRVLGALGIKKLIITNACGAIGDNFRPGQLMAIRDHINLSWHSPLLGPNLNDFGPRFVDMTTAYNPRLISLAKKAAHAAGITMHEGVYAGLIGPCYETPAEIRMLKTLGADAVGMSTVCETIVARHMGIDVLGISCLTNMAAGLGKQEITHDEVMHNNAKVAGQFASVLKTLISELS